MSDISGIAARMREAAERIDYREWFVDKPPYSRTFTVKDAEGYVADNLMEGYAHHIATSNPANVLAILADRDSKEHALAEAYQAVGALGDVIDLCDNEHFIRLQDILAYGKTDDGKDLLPFPCTAAELAPNAITNLTARLTEAEKDSDLNQIQMEEQAEVFAARLVETDSLVSALSDCMDDFQSETQRLIVERDAAIQENEEQARLLGEGGSRELRLIAERDAAIAEVAKQGRMTGQAQAERDAALGMMEEAGEALEPFAVQAARVSADYDHYDASHQIQLGRYGMILRGDLCRAHSTFTRITETLKQINRPDAVTAPGTNGE